VQRVLVRSRVLVSMIMRRFAEADHNRSIV
jgi:hypothetical protein